MNAEEAKRAARSALLNRTTMLQRKQDETSTGTGLSTDAPAKARRRSTIQPTASLLDSHSTVAGAESALAAHNKATPPPPARATVLT